jgi:hypothetical protein
MITSTWPERSTTAAEVLYPLDLHSAKAASAIVFAIASERLRCITTPCAMTRSPDMAAMATTAQILALETMTPPIGADPLGLPIDQRDDEADRRMGTINPSLDPRRRTAGQHVYRPNGRVRV